MIGGESAALRAAVLHMERYRSAIEGEVNRRLGGAEPTPDARAEIIRRFRTYCRLASLGMDNARPSLDGLGGQEPIALERAISVAVAIAIECEPTPEIAAALRRMESLFRAGIRRLMQPAETRKKRKGRRRMPNAGKRVRSAIDRIGDAYLALNIDTGKVFDLNPAAETLLGADASKLLDQSFENLIAPQDRQFYQDLEARLDAGEDAGPVDVVLARPNGDFVRVECMISQHMIASKRLAIFTARERLKGITLP